MKVIIEALLLVISFDVKFVSADDNELDAARDLVCASVVQFQPRYTRTVHVPRARDTLTREARSS